MKRPSAPPSAVTPKQKVLKRPSCHDVETPAEKKKKESKSDMESVPKESAEGESAESEKHFEEDASVEEEPMEEPGASSGSKPDVVQKKPSTTRVAVEKKPAAKAAVAKTKSQKRQRAEKISETEVNGWLVQVFRRNTSKTPFPRFQDPEGRVFWSKTKAIEAGFHDVD